MRIRYEPHRGMTEVELRDIRGGDALAKWFRGDEREIPEGTMVVWADGKDPARPVDAATAIFRHGPDFVDAVTGKNPLYTCADCGGPALEEHALDFDHDSVLPFVNDAGKRLCVACWLGRNPKWIPGFRDLRGFPKDTIERAIAIAKRAPAASVASAQRASTEEEDA